MRLKDHRLLAALVEFIKAEVAYCREHEIARLAAIDLCLPHQALVNQAGEAVNYVTFQALSSATLGLHQAFGGIEGAAASENSKTAEKRLLLRAEEVVAPGNGSIESLLAGGEVSRPAAQELEAPLQALQDGLRREELGTSGCKLYSEGEAVEASTDFGYRSGILPGEGEIRTHCLGAVHEEGDRRDRAERGRTKLGLA